MEDRAGILLPPGTGPFLHRREAGCGTAAKEGPRTTGDLCTLEKEQTVSFAIVSLILLVVIAIIAIPILLRLFSEAASRNPNRPEGGDEFEGDRSRRSGTGRE